MVTLSVTAEEGKLSFFDGSENASTQMYLGDAVKITTAPATDFPVPVDAVRKLETDRITLDCVPAVAVRDRMGRPIQPTRSDGYQCYPRGSYVIDLSTPVMTWIATDSSLRLSSDGDRLQIDFPDQRSVRIGARGLHRRPESTITVTMNPGDLFRAISTFGSTLTTFSPARSFPSLRGHPPRVRVGDRLKLPATATPPSTGVLLELPATVLHAIAASPVAYYLGAQLVPAGESRLLVDDEPVADLPGGRGFAEACTKLLYRNLLLDCLARTQWGIDDALPLRQHLADELAIDWGELRQMAYPERIKTYLEFPEQPIRNAMPSWAQHVSVVPTSRAVESTPYLAYDLVAIRPQRHRRVTGPPPAPRHYADGGMRIRNRDRRSARHLRGEANNTALGERLPVGINPVFPIAFEHRLDRPEPDGTVTIAVVCNDKKMSAELEFAESVYASRERFPVSVDRYEELTTAELRSVITSPIDYFHYIGHIDEQGFECSDGSLDATTIDTVGVEVCFLNACRSIEQAVALIEGGGIGGIATRNAVVNSAAVSLGETIASLLIRGIPIGIALALAGAESPIGHKYTVIGDPKLDIAQPESVVPYYCEISSQPDGEFEVNIHSCLTTSGRLGCAISFRLDEDTPYYLNPMAEQFILSRESLRDFLSLEAVPVKFNGSLGWSTEWVDRLDESS